MNLIFCHCQPELGAAWNRHFHNAANVTIADCDLLEVETDAIVSPANSFGFMDGGLDYHLCERLSQGTDL